VNVVADGKLKTGAAAAAAAGGELVVEVTGGMTAQLLEITANWSQLPSAAAIVDFTRSTGGTAALQQLGISTLLTPSTSRLPVSAAGDITASVLCKLTASPVDCCELAVTLPESTVDTAALTDSLSATVPVLPSGCDVKPPNLKPPTAFQLPVTWKGCSTDGAADKAEVVFEHVSKAGDGFAVGTETAADDDTVPATCTHIITGSCSSTAH